jgi:hypothetical protein
MSLARRLFADFVAAAAFSSAGLVYFRNANVRQK